MVEENLEIPIKGEPPPGLNLAGKGDAHFEKSRGMAQRELDNRKTKSTGERIDKATAFREYRRSTGVEVKETSIEALPDIVSNADDKNKNSKGWMSWKQKVVKDFIAWASSRGLKSVLDIDKEQANSYLETLYRNSPEEDKKEEKKSKTISAITARRIKPILAQAFAIALPDGAFNPWKAPDVMITAAKEDRQVHRTPLTIEEVNKLLEASKDDDLSHDLIVTALSTGLRRGDVCRLKWSGVNMQANAIKLTTGKTGSDLYLPILPTFKAVLEKRLAEKKEHAAFVFPEAERLIRKNPDAITWGIKKAFAKAFYNSVQDAPEITQDEPEVIPLPEALPKVLKYVEQAKMSDSKRSKLIEVLARHAKGQGYREIGAALNISRGAISTLLHDTQDLSKITFMPDRRKAFSMTRAVDKITRQQRKFGKRSASIYDFHALRTTFVTLAISNGFSIDKLRAITGHATVEIVLKHYFKPKGTDFTSELSEAMPDSLTRIHETKRVSGPPKGKAWKLKEILGSLSESDKKKLVKMITQKGDNA
jgi:integrase